MIKEAVLSLGSNLGCREQNLKYAIEALGRLPKTKIEKLSKIYETTPVEVKEKQPEYLNCCVMIKTELSAEVLLGAALGIEAAMKRQRPHSHASRVIDIDLLLYEGEKRNTPEISLPHPGMLKRAFVLVPLRDLYESEKALGIDFSGKLKALRGQDVREYKRRVLSHIF